MKTLHLSIILSCTFLAFFIPSISEEESITVSTDKTSYDYGSNYTISGKVNPVLQHEAVSIMILSTSYMHPESFSVTPSSDGRYSYTLPLPVKAISGGNFTIIAQYAGVKNQTSFNYAGLPCNQQNIPAYVNSVPIIRGPPAMNPRILDSSGNAVIGPVKTGEQIQISYTLANGLDCNQPFVYIVQIQDHNGITVSLSWITGTLLASQSFDPAQSWVPRHNDTYTAQIFTWQSLDNPNALMPPASFTFDVEPNANFTQSSQVASGIQSKLESQTVISNSPLEQFKSGVTTQNITCKEGFVLAIKKQGHQPACVNPDTIPKLVLRGWSENPLNELLLRYGNQTQANLVFYDIMNEPKVRDWSMKGWRYSDYSYASNGDTQQSSATVHLYLPPNTGKHLECENGSYAIVVMNLKPVKIEYNYTKVGCEIVTTTAVNVDPELNRK